MWYLCKQTRNEWLKKLIYSCTNPILWDRRIYLGEGNHTLQICSRVPLSGFYLATIETLLGALEGARIPWICGELSSNYLPIRPAWDLSLQTWSRLKANENCWSTLWFIKLICTLDLDGKDNEENVVNNRTCMQCKCRVPLLQVDPVHPEEHWHLLGATQEPWLELQPWEQIAKSKIKEFIG